MYHNFIFELTRLIIHQVLQDFQGNKKKFELLSFSSYQGSNN